MKTACITGITGQTGSYLAELLLDKGYDVYGLIRRSSTFTTDRIDHIFNHPKLHLQYGDLADALSIVNFIYDAKPDMFINAGAQSVAADERLPILKCNCIDHPTIEELWNTCSKNYNIKKTNIDGLDVEVIDLSSPQIRAMGYWNGMGSWFKVKQISRHWYKDKIANLNQKFGEINVTSNHSIYDTNHQLTTPDENPWLLNVRKINYTCNKSSLEISLSGNDHEFENEFIHKTNDTTRLKTHLSGKTLESFCKFIGIFIAEGHTTYNVANKSYLVGISEQNLDFLKEIESNLKEFYDGPSCFVRHKKDNYKDVWELQIRSKTLYYWLRANCGTNSFNKKIPKHMLQLSKKYLKKMFEMMLFGDGCYDIRKRSKAWRYTTASYHLSCQLSFLITMLGYDYTVNIEKHENENKYYHFRETIIYQYNQGSSGKNLNWHDYDGYVYDISVDEVQNFAIGVGNIVVHNSHVRVSFDIPEYTFDIDATGAVRCLEVIRKYSPHTKFLQCSSSELFGSTPPPQSEQTSFHPRSPYAAAKCAAYWATINYREAYKLFAVNSISFNHECLEYNTPIIVRENGVVTVCRPVDLISLRRKSTNTQTFDFHNVEIWDGSKWTKLKAITATKINQTNDDHKIFTTQARCGVVSTTAHHHMLIAEENTDAPKQGIIQAKNINKGDLAVTCISMPECQNWTAVSDELAEFLGYMTADGYIPKKRPSLQFTNNNKHLRNRVAELWSKLFLGTTREDVYKSGFKPSNNVTQLYLNGKNELCEWLRKQLYNSDGFKKVPDIILNANIKTQSQYLETYYAGDGLKKGKGDSFVTNSSVLAQGLIWLYKLQGRDCSVYAEMRNNTTYYRVNVKSKDAKFGQHLAKNPSEIRKISENTPYDCWVFDIETESAVLCAGVGTVVVHNSPRRGETFVTRKITRAATRIKMGLQDKLVLGNLDAKRDWSHAKDIAKAMILILESDIPDDYIIASGESHSIKEFVNLVFDKLNLDPDKYIKFDPKYLRPAEVDHLRGDPSKIQKKLGWKPEYSFETLIDEMIEHDMNIAKTEKMIQENI